jgi:hypothetical protein
MLDYHVVNYIHDQEEITGGAFRTLFHVDTLRSPHVTMRRVATL